MQFPKSPRLHAGCKSWEGSPQSRQAKGRRGEGNRIAWYTQESSLTPYSWKSQTWCLGWRQPKTWELRIGMRGQNFISFIYFNFRCLRQKQTKTKINLLVSFWCPLGRVVFVLLGPHLLFLPVNYCKWRHIKACVPGTFYNFSPFFDVWLILMLG